MTCLAAATMRSASRPSFPGQPVSISKDCPVGVTNKVACPPSTSTKKIRRTLSALGVRAPHTQESRRNEERTYKAILGRWRQWHHATAELVLAIFRPEFWYAETRRSSSEDHVFVKQNCTSRLRLPTDSTPGFVNYTRCITYSGSCAWPMIVKVASAVGALVPGCPPPMEKR